MSATIPPSAESSSTELLTPRSIIGFMAMMIAGGTVAATFWLGDKQLQSQALVGAIAMSSAVMGYYFGASRSADKIASKNADLAAQAATTGDSK